MPVCTKCGLDNPLGRVFCTGCGSKLDIGNLTSEDIAESQRPGWFARSWKMILVLVIVAIVAVGCAVMWPRTDVIGEKGNIRGGRNIQAKLKAYSSTVQARNRRLGPYPPLQEADINGYFEFFAAKKIKAVSVSTSIQDGFFALRVARPIASWEVFGFAVRPTLSCDIVCVPQEGSVRVAKAALGHLPMIGPGKNLVGKMVYGMFSDDKDLNFFQYLVDVKAEKGQIFLTVEKK